jgi:hypothetical protein
MQKLENSALHRWKGAASDVFLLEAVRLMESKGYSMGNIDITIIAEKPKISPHKQKILDNLYSILKTPADTINVKVGTTVPSPPRRQGYDPGRRAWWRHLFLISSARSGRRCFLIILFL